MDNKYEPIRQAAITLGVSIVVAAAFLGWSLPGTPRPQNYEAYVVDNKIVRLDTREGHLVACDFSRCVRVLGNGKEVQPNSAPSLIASPEEGQSGRASIPAPNESRPAQP